MRITDAYRDADGQAAWEAVVGISWSIPKSRL